MMEQRKNYPVILLYALSFIAVACFWLMYGVFSYYNRFATDDYSLIDLANHRGVLGGTLWFYFHWTGGFFATLFQAATLHFIQNSPSLLGYNLFLMGLFSASLFWAVYELAAYYKTDITALRLLLASQLFIQLLFFSGFAINENWFWVVGSSGYIYPLCLALVSGAAFIRYKRSKRYAFLALSFIAILCFGSYPVNYVLLCFCLGGLLFLYVWYATKKIPVDLFIYLTVMFIGLTINLVAPGNYKRMAEHGTTVTKHISFAYQILHHPVKIIGKSLVPYNILLGIIFSLPLVALLSAPFFGAKITYGRLTLAKTTGVAFAIYMAAVFSNILINYKALGWGLGSSRSMMLISISFLLIFIGAVALLFNYLNYKTILLYSALAVLPLCIYRSISTLRKQYPVVKEYAAAHDARTKIIEQAKTSFTGPILYLQPLPPSGILLTAEMGKDTTNYINVDMKSRFDLPFALALK